MPAGDGTGPAGMGPGTGRGMGYCGDYDAPDWANPGPGWGFYGRGSRGIRGGCWGWRHQYYATGLPRWAQWGPPRVTAYGAPYEPPSRAQEVEMLRDDAEWLKEQLDAINKRMDELSQE